MSDSKILLLLKENNPVAWEHLYDKYAPVMFGIISNMIADKRVAEEILINLFHQLKEDKPLQQEAHTSLCMPIIRHTNIGTRMELKKRGIAYPCNFFSGKYTVQPIPVKKFQQ